MTQGHGSSDGLEAGDHGVTKQLCEWIQKVSLDDVPEDVRIRAKYLILDGLACAIVGSHLPWTETAARAVFDMESPGNCSVWGYDKVFSISRQIYSTNLVNEVLDVNTDIENWRSTRRVVEQHCYPGIRAR